MRGAGVITMLGDVSTDELSRTTPKAADHRLRRGPAGPPALGRAAGAADGDLHRVRRAAVPDP